MKHISKGFTLIEVMIVVVIIGILASIASPSAEESVRRTNRAEGQAFLQDLAARQERYFSQNNSYTTDPSKLGSGTGSETGRYTVTITAPAGSGGYLLTAAPSFSDTKCGNLTLNALGVKGAGATDCWR